MSDHSEHAREGDERIDLLDGLWLTITELAEHKGLGKPWISERVKSLEESGKITTRAGKGRTKLVNLAHFDRAVGETGDAFKETAAETRAGNDDGASDAPAVPALRDHQVRLAQYSADLKCLELEERLGRLVPIDDAKVAGVKIGEAVVRIVGRLPTYAETITASAIKDGVLGARGALKEIEREVRSAIAEALRDIIGAAVPSTFEPGKGDAPA